VRVVLWVVFLFGHAALAQTDSRPSKPEAKKQPGIDKRGTEHQPLVIKGFPPPLVPESEDVRQERRGRALVAESIRHSLEDIKTDSFRNVLLTLFLVVVGSAQVALFWWQLRLIRRSSDDAAASASAAMKTADVAEATVATMKINAEQQLRAYVFLEALPYYSHRNPVNGRVWWSIHPVWKNGGATPTRALELNVNSALRDDPLPLGFDFPDAPGESIPMLIGPQSSIRARRLGIDGDGLLAVRSRTKYFYIWGSARYQDVFVGTSQRITKFCVQVTDVTGDPTRPYDRETNIVEIVFNFYRANNCLDEGCRGA
jgi:hypothetical protein